MNAREFSSSSSISMLINDVRMKMIVVRRRQMEKKNISISKKNCSIAFESEWNEWSLMANCWALISLFWSVINSYINRKHHQLRVYRFVFLQFGSLVLELHRRIRQRRWKSFCGFLFWIQKSSKIIFFCSITCSFFSIIPRDYYAIHNAF